MANSVRFSWRCGRLSGWEESGQPTSHPRIRYCGLLYRALNPTRARDPLSGEGTRKHGGRFNLRGMPALYTAQSEMMAIREANQIGMLQPTVQVAYEANVGPI
jgi:RES domain-containing protein